LNQG